MAKLRYKIGTMGSSKSADLLISEYRYRQQGKKTLVFKPSQDTRNDGVIYSRALNEELPCISILPPDKDKMFNLAAKEQPKCILVDEVQFMTEAQIEELTEIVDLLEIPVIAYGLLTDFQGLLFPGSKRLIEVGAVLEEVKNVCWYCNKRATHNMRFRGTEPVFEGNQVEIEDLDETDKLNTSEENTNLEKIKTKEKKLSKESKESKEKYSYRSVCRSCYNEIKKQSLKRK